MKPSSERNQIILAAILVLQSCLTSAYLTSKKGNITITYKTNDGLKSVDDPYEPDPEAEDDEGRMIIDRPKGVEPVGPLGRDFGGSIGVGPADGVRCLPERPMGEDGLEYCKYVSPEEQKLTLARALSKLLESMFEIFLRMLVALHEKNQYQKMVSE